jgi:hypothetical protein
MTVAEAEEWRGRFLLGPRRHFVPDKRKMKLLRLIRSVLGLGQ